MNNCKNVILGVFILIISGISLSYSQRVVQHDYPRLAVMSWLGGNPDWLSRFDLIMGNNIDSLTFRRVKAINPNVYILSITDWNMGGPFAVWNNPDVIPVEWRLRHSDGTYIKIYGAQNFVDPTDYCGLYNGERYNQALPRKLMEETDWSAFDGVSSGGSWPFPYNTGGDIDLDRNGINDYTEHGESWIRMKWQEGQNKMRQNLRDRFKLKWGNPNEKLIFYWTINDTMCVRVANGGGWENMYQNSPKTFSSWVPLINQWDSIGTLPRINSITADIVYDSVNAPDRHKDYYRFVRWALCTALLNDVYFMSGDITDHHWTNYYDEYDVKLGYPKGKAQKLSNGCYVRFFDNGAVIVNPTNTTQTVTNSNISSLAGYDGPYYRFKGNQDPVWNDGSLFTSVTMTATKASYSGSTQYVGDGIILVKTPTTVVSEIIIDNAYSGTSPGSSPAYLTGFSWDRDAQYGSGNPTWFTNSQHATYNENYYDSYYAASGTGTAKAIFKPTINVSGQYKVYEWHGWRGRYASSYKEATNVPCTIVHSSGTTNLTIDQTTNYGQWNLLGTYTFSAGGNYSATITNNANGYVIADAFKFVYVGDSNGVPNIPNLDSPSNGSINFSSSINFVWDSVPNAISYNLQIALDSTFSQIFFDDSTLTTTFKQVSSFDYNKIYFWRVRAKNNYSSSVFSDVWHFSVQQLADKLNINNSYLNFGKVLVNTTKIDSVVFNNNSQDTVEISNINVSSTQFSVNTSALIILPNSMNSLKVMFTPVKKGTFTGNIVFSYLRSLKTDTIKVSGQGVIPPRNKKSLSKIVFADVVPGKSTVDSFYIYNEGDIDLKVDSIFTTSSSITVSSSKLVVSPNDSVLMFISASPMFNKPESAYVIFIDNSTKSPDSILVEINQLTNIGETLIPTNYSLEQNFPNPFNPSTTIKYSLPYSSEVIIRIYNIIGQEIITLVNQIENSGYKTVIWNGIDQNGNQVPSGVYIYRIDVRNISDTRIKYSDVKKMILMK